MANLGQELASLDFANLIGGPLNAMVDAQAKSAIATSNFVQQVGFDKDGQVRTSTFRYSKPNQAGDNEEFALTVPFISMLPIPFLKIEEGEVEFNAKLTSTQETQNSSTIGADASLDVQVNYWFVKASVKASASYKKTTSSTEKIEKTYEMRVLVKVRGTELPTGMDRLFGLLENSLQETPTGKLTGTCTLLDDLKGTELKFTPAPDSKIKAGDIVTLPGIAADPQNKIEAQPPIDAVVASRDDKNLVTLTAPAQGFNTATVYPKGTTVSWSRKRTGSS
jgi:hypothetical protein